MTPAGFTAQKHLYLLKEALFLQKTKHVLCVAPDYRLPVNHRHRRPWLEKPIVGSKVPAARRNPAGCKGKPGRNLAATAISSSLARSPPGSHPNHLLGTTEVRPWAPRIWRGSGQQLLWVRRCGCCVCCVTEREKKKRIAGKAVGIDFHSVPLIFINLFIDFHRCSLIFQRFSSISLLLHRFSLNDPRLIRSDLGWGGVRGGRAKNKKTWPKCQE